MKWAGVGLILVTAACSAAPSPAAQVSAAATRTPSHAATPSPASAASPAGTPTPIAHLDFTCRLPFVEQIDPAHFTAGFISFPAGTFAADPNASPTGMYYDAPVSRWLPVGRSAVAPDGLRYAFMTGGSPSQTPGPPRLHVVDATTGAETVFDLQLPGEQPYGVVAYSGAGVYIGSGWEGTAFGNWRVDPSSGATTALGKADLVFDDGTGHAWLPVVDPRDRAPAISALTGRPLPDEIVRRELSTGVDTVWFYRPGFNVTVAAAFVAGGILAWTETPMSDTSGGRHEYWLVPAPGRSTLVAHIEYGGATVADAHGVWMGGGEGLHLFTADGKVQRVFSAAGDPVGGCL